MNTFRLEFDYLRQKGTNVSHFVCIPLLRWAVCSAYLACAVVRRCISHIEVCVCVAIWGLLSCRLFLLLPLAWWPGAPPHDAAPLSSAQPKTTHPAGASGQHRTPSPDVLGLGGGVGVWSCNCSLVFTTEMNYVYILNREIASHTDCFLHNLIYRFTWCKDWVPMLVNCICRD